MEYKNDADITVLLKSWSEGNDQALDELVPVVYDELRRMARRYMSGQNVAHTLQTTALIHEAYLKLVGCREHEWASRDHFFAVAARAMRHVLVDHARTRNRDKRGGAARAIELDEAAVVFNQQSELVVALDEALVRLAEIDPRKAQVVELRYFGGMSIDEVSTVLGVSVATINRDWSFAKVWLLRELTESEV